MPKFEISPARLKVYALFVEGYPASLVSRKLAISNEQVRRHKDALIVEGYIIMVHGCKCPILYTRGPNANLLDELLSRRLSSPRESQGGGLTTSAPSNVDVPTSRTHLNGRITFFPVLKVGSFKSLSISGQELPLFAGPPYNNNKTVKRWKAKLLIDGYQYSLEFSESLNDGSLRLHVWPPERRQTASEICGSEAMMIQEAQQVANILGKNGWQFGSPVLIGNLEYGLADSPLAKIIPPVEERIQVDDMWVDHSHGVQEPETSNVAKAKIALGLPGEVLALRSDVDKLVQIAVLNYKTALVKEGKTAPESEPFYVKDAKKKEPSEISYA